MPLLNEADALYLGEREVDAAYLGSKKVWPRFSPAELTGLTGWYDASELTLADGASVTTWSDLSGQNRHLAPVTTSPKLRTNALNGLPVIRFDGVENVLWTSSGGTYRHFFIVAMYRTALFTEYDGLLGGVDLLVLTADGASTTTWYPYEPHAITYHLNGTVALGLWPAPMNSQFGVISVGRHTGEWTVIRLNVGQDRNVAGRFWDGDVAEVICYDRMLLAAERVQVEEYLRAKWGL